MSPQERSQLIDALIDGDISEADFLRIEAEFSIDPAARREYYDRLSLSALLEAEAKVSKANSPKVIPMPVMQRNWIPTFAALAAALVGLITIGVLLVSRPLKLPTVAAVAEETASGFGVIAGQANAVWKHAPTLADGSMVRPGLMELTSGVAQLELFSGVSIVVEGDAAFEVISPMEMRVTRGRIRARVPDAAHGFRIHTTEGEVVDLGTEFALDVASGHSEVHVIDGEVEWHPRAETMRRMKAGEAVRWGANGQHAMLAARSDEFVGVGELARKVESSRQARRDEWRRFSNSLKRDPRLAAYYQMNTGEAWSRIVPNLSQTGSGIIGEAAVVAAARVTDRWGDAAGALDFSPAGSRVRVNVPGEYGSITLLCWVKINSLDRWYNSLFLTDGHEPGEPHWQIMDDGRLFFSVKKGAQDGKGRGDKHNFYSPAFWNTSLSGQWILLATVYDIEARRVTHFLNGDVLGSEAIPEEFLVETVRINAASIGNWSEPMYRTDPEFVVRNLNGSMDEFALFSEALSPKDIKEIYDHGKP